jgi:cytosine/adenosine deaminase-related metal-dependent hydrolase
MFICSPELLQETLVAARRHDLRIQVHVAEYVPEVEMVRERYGETPVGLLHRIGFLGPDIVLGHCVYTSGHPDVGGDPGRDLSLIADAGSSVAHSPRLFFASGRALHSLPRYLDHGVNVGIGCDTWPSDIIEEMRLAWFMGKQTSRTAERPTCHEVFAAATVGSANALGRQDLGRLASGAQADLVCVDLSHYHYGPVLDPVRSLVLFGRGQDVDTVFVAGQRVVEDGRVLNADEDELRAAAPGIHRSLAQAVAQRDPLGRTPEALLDLRDSAGGIGNV